LTWARPGQGWCFGGRLGGGPGGADTSPYGSIVFPRSKTLQAGQGGFPGFGEASHGWQKTEKGVAGKKVRLLLPACSVFWIAVGPSLFCCQCVVALVQGKPTGGKQAWHRTRTGFPKVTVKPGGDVSNVPSGENPQGFDRGRGPGDKTCYEPIHQRDKNGSWVQIGGRGDRGGQKCQGKTHRFDCGAAGGGGTQGTAWIPPQKKRPTKRGRGSIFRFPRGSGWDGCSPPTQKLAEKKNPPVAGGGGGGGRGGKGGHGGAGLVGLPVHVTPPKRGQRPGNRRKSVTTPKLRRGPGPGSSGTGGPGRGGNSHR